MGADFRFRNSRLSGGTIIEGVAWYQQTDVEGKSGDDASYGFGISSPNNQSWRGGYAFKRVEKNFDPAVGFVNQTDVESHALDFGSRRFFRAGGYFRSLYSGFEGYRAETLEDGKVDTQSIGLRLSLENNTGDRLFARVFETDENLITDFTIHRSSDGLRTVVIPQGIYSF